MEAKFNRRHLIATQENHFIVEKQICLTDRISGAYFWHTMGLACPLFIKEGSVMLVSYISVTEEMWEIFFRDFVFVTFVHVNMWHALWSVSLLWQFTSKKTNKQANKTNKKEKALKLDYGIYRRLGLLVG